MTSSGRPGCGIATSGSATKSSNQNTFLVKMPDGQFAEFHRDLFTRHYDFAKVLIDSGLVLPALDQCLKCSHLFNVLDASGSIGVTERTSYILRVRQLAVAIAQAWVASEPASGDAHGS